MHKHEHPVISRETVISEMFRVFPHKSQRLQQVMAKAGLPWNAKSHGTLDTLEGFMENQGKKEKVSSLIEELHEVVEEESDLTTVALTPKAAERVKFFLKKLGKIGWGIRFADIAGNCGSSEYILDLSERPGPQDTVFHSHGIEIHVPKDGLKNLLGSVIHFDESPAPEHFEGMLKEGFTITNPNIRGACACSCNRGHSF